MILELSGDPEVYRQAAITQIQRTRDFLATLAPSDGTMPTVLPFWNVSEVVGHMYVLSGFFTTSTWLICRGLASRPPGIRVLSAVNLLRPLVLPALHYSNIVAPLAAARVFPFRVERSLVSESLERAQRQIEHIPEDLLSQSFTFFGYWLSTALYLGVVAKECAVHRWEIQNALGEAALDEEVASFLPELLWASTPLCTRLRREAHGTVEVNMRGRRLQWSLDGKRVTALPRLLERPDATIEGGDAEFALAALDRMPPNRLRISGDAELASRLLGSFSYQAGPMPFFNP